jgi:hypothetical protein
MGPYQQLKHSGQTGVTVSRKEILIKDIGAARSKGILNTLIEAHDIPEKAKVKVFGEVPVQAVSDTSNPPWRGQAT